MKSTVVENKAATNLSISKIVSPPENGSPTKFRVRIMGRDAFRWPQSAVLSPVQMGPRNQLTVPVS